MLSVSLDHDDDDDVTATLYSCRRFGSKLYKPRDSVTKGKKNKFQSYQGNDTS